MMPRNVLVLVSVLGVVLALDDNQISDKLSALEQAVTDRTPSGYKLTQELHHQLTELVTHYASHTDTPFDADATLKLYRPVCFMLRRSGLLSASDTERIFRLLTSGLDLDLRFGALLLTLLPPPMLRSPSAAFLLLTLLDRTLPSDQFANQIISVTSHVTPDMLQAPLHLFFERIVATSVSAHGTLNAWFEAGTPLRNIWDALLQRCPMMLLRSISAHATRTLSPFWWSQFFLPGLRDLFIRSVTVLIRLERDANGTRYMDTVRQFIAPQADSDQYAAHAIMRLFMFINIDARVMLDYLRLKDFATLRRHTGMIVEEPIMQKFHTLYTCRIISISDIIQYIPTSDIPRLFGYLINTQRNGSFNRSIRSGGRSDVGNIIGEIHELLIRRPKIRYLSLYRRTVSSTDCNTCSMDFRHIALTLSNRICESSAYQSALATFDKLKGDQAAIAIERLLHISSVHVTGLNHDNVTRNMFEIAVAAFPAAICGDAFVPIVTRVLQSPFWNATGKQLDVLVRAVNRFERSDASLLQTILQNPAIVSVLGAGTVNDRATIALLVRGQYRLLDEMEQARVREAVPEAVDVLETELQQLRITPENIDQVRKFAQKPCPICLVHMMSSDVESLKAVMELELNPISSLVSCVHFLHLECAQRLACEAARDRNLSRCPECQTFSVVLL